MIIYINKSNHERYINIIIYSFINNIIKKEYIDINDIYNIYVMKLMVIKIIIILFKEKIQEFLNIHIFTNNQVMIQVIKLLK